MNSFVKVKLASLLAVAGSADLKPDSSVDDVIRSNAAAHKHSDPKTKLNLSKPVADRIAELESSKTADPNGETSDAPETPATEPDETNADETETETETDAETSETETSETDETETTV